MQRHSVTPSGRHAVGHHLRVLFSTKATLLAMVDLGFTFDNDDTLTLVPLAD
jgi:hypothetical protein